MGGNIGKCFKENTRGAFLAVASALVAAWGMNAANERNCVASSRNEGARRPTPTKAKNRYGIGLRRYPKLGKSYLRTENPFSGKAYLCTFASWKMMPENLFLIPRSWIDQALGKNFSRGKTITELKGGGKARSFVRPFSPFFGGGVDIPPLYHRWTAFCWTPTISARRRRQVATKIS